MIIIEFMATVLFFTLISMFIIGVAFLILISAGKSVQLIYEYIENKKSKKTPLGYINIEYLVKIIDFRKKIPASTFTKEEWYKIYSLGYVCTNNEGNDLLLGAEITGKIK